MKLNVPAPQIDLVFMGMGTEQTQAAKKDYNTGAQKLDEQGRPLYAVRTMNAVRLDENKQPIGKDDSVTLAVRNPGPVNFGEIYELVGNVTVVHWVDKAGRIAVSLTADGFHPRNQKSASKDD